TSITDSSSVTLVQSTYDNLGRTTSVARAAGPTESRVYGADLRLSALTYGFVDSSKNVTFSYAYSLAGQAPSATPSNAIYSWPSAGSATSYVSDGQNRYATAGSNSL